MQSEALPDCYPDLGNLKLTDAPFNCAQGEASLSLSSLKDLKCPSLIPEFRAYVQVN